MTAKPLTAEQCDAIAVEAEHLIDYPSHPKDYARLYRTLAYLLRASPLERAPQQAGKCACGPCVRPRAVAGFFCDACSSTGRHGLDDAGCPACLRPADDSARVPTGYCVWLVWHGGRYAAAQSDKPCEGERVIPGYFATEAEAIAACHAHAASRAPAATADLAATIAKMQTTDGSGVQPDLPPGYRVRPNTLLAGCWNAEREDGQRLDGENRPGGSPVDTSLGEAVARCWADHIARGGKDALADLASVLSKTYVTSASIRDASWREIQRRLGSATAPAATAPPAPTEPDREALGRLALDTYEMALPHHVPLKWSELELPARHAFREVGTVLYQRGFAAASRAAREVDGPGVRTHNGAAYCVLCGSQCGKGHQFHDWEACARRLRLALTDSQEARTRERGVADRDLATARAEAGEMRKHVEAIVAAYDNNRVAHRISPSHEAERAKVLSETIDAARALLKGG